MAEIVITDVTSGTLPGTGAFDELMSSNQLRLDKQYAQNRLRGADYAKVYLGSMEAIMQQAIVYILGRQEADKKAELIEEQTIKTEAETRLVEAQILKVVAETALVEQETLNAIIQGQILTETVLKVIAETSLIGKQEDLIDGQILKIVQEIELTKAQVWSEKGKVSSDCSIIAPPTVIGGLIGGQLQKIENEGFLIAQKVITETAQTASNTVDDSVIGKQKLLYQAQTDGFARDAEQKLCKIMADSWNTRRVTDEQTTARNTGLEDDEINRVMNAAKNGIGLRWNIREVLDSDGNAVVPAQVVTETQNPANTFCLPEDPGCA